MKSWHIGKDPDAGRDWGQEENGTTKDEMAAWHHRPDGHEFEQTPGVCDGQGGLVCCDSRLSDWTELNWTERASWHYCWFPTGETLWQHAIHGLQRSVWCLLCGSLKEFSFKLTCSLGSKLYYFIAAIFMLQDVLILYRYLNRNACQIWYPNWCRSKHPKLWVRWH